MKSHITLRNELTALASLEGNCGRKLRRFAEANLADGKLELVVNQLEPLTPCAAVALASLCVERVYRVNDTFSYLADYNERTSQSVTLNCAGVSLTDNCVYFTFEGISLEGLSVGAIKELYQTLAEVLFSVACYRSGADVALMTDLLAPYAEGRSHEEFQSLVAKTVDDVNLLLGSFAGNPLTPGHAVLAALPDRELPYLVDQLMTLMLA